MSVSVRSLLRRSIDAFTPNLTLKVGASRFQAPLLLLNGTARAVADHHRYERWFRDLARRLLGLREGAVLDVGANVGQTLLAILEIEPSRRYIGFEPQASCCAGLNRFIEDNNLTNHAVMAVGLGETSGILALGTRSREDVSASLVREYRPAGFHSHYAPVPVCRGDEVLGALDVSDVAMLKIDVEGGELAVMRGFSELLARRLPPVIFELLPNFLPLTRQEIDEETKAWRARMHAEMFSFLVEKGYSIFRIVPGEAGGLARLERLSRLQADARRLDNCIALSPQDVARLLPLVA
jgi:FkbM family methyltransferase